MPPPAPPASPPPGPPPGHDAPLLRLADVTAGYGGPPVVEGVSLTVARHGFLGIVGPSGGGKTTLLRLLAGALRPSGGTVERATGLRVGYVSQVQAIDWSFPLTVAECVLLARTATRWRPWPDRGDRRAAGVVLERLGIAALADRHLRDLSGGQQQRVFLARALLQDPDVVLLDEPTSGVDLRTRHEVLHLLADLQAGGLAASDDLMPEHRAAHHHAAGDAAAAHTPSSRPPAGPAIVLSTHDLNGVAAHLPTVACLNRRLVAVGRPAEVLVPEVLEATYGAPLHVLSHAGLPVVVG